MKLKSILNKVTVMVMGEKIVIVSGDLKKGSCGVCDYTSQLYKNLVNKKREDFRIDIVNFKNVSLKVIKENDVFIFNYPCPEYGYNISPFFKLLAARLLRKKVIYVMHEYTYVHILRKIMILSFLYISSKIVSVTQEEINKMNNHLKKKSEFIPIASNLANVKNDRTFKYKSNEIVLTFFGAFYPAKKVEHIIEVTKRLVETGKNVKLQLIGARHEKHVDYLTKLEKLVNEYNLANFVEWHINCEDSKVISLMENSTVCVMPYEEGVTMRRSTFLTAIDLEIPVITTLGEDTPEIIKGLNSVRFGDSVEEITNEVLLIISNPNLYYESAKDAKNRISQSWSKISDSFIQLALADN